MLPARHFTRRPQGIYCQRQRRNTIQYVLQLRALFPVFTAHLMLKHSQEPGMVGFRPLVHSI